MLIEMELREILQGVDMEPLILLVEKGGGERQLPIMIGKYEVDMLRFAVFKERALRPLTHDLVLNVITGLGATLKRIIVDQISKQQGGGVISSCYHGKLDLEMADQTRTWIDSRPSDAIILATKLGLPIYVDEEVLKSQDQEEPEDGLDGDDGPGEEED